MSDKISLPFDIKKEIFLWGPIPGYFLYTSVFTVMNSFYFSKKYSNHRWSRTVYLFRNCRMLWVNDKADLYAAGLKVFKKYFLSSDSRIKIYTEWKQCVKTLTLIQNKINKINLEKINNKDLLSLWHDLHDAYLDFWLSGTIPELSNYGSDKFLEELLVPIIKNSDDLNQALEVLTAPDKLSFYQREEVDLLKTSDLKKHQSRYFWLKNSYSQVISVPISFFSKRKKQIDLKLIDRLRNHFRDIKRHRIVIQRKYNLSSTIMMVAKAIRAGIVWQDQRKKYIFICLHFQTKMAKEIARRFNYSFGDLLNCGTWEIDEIIRGKNIKSILSSRRSGFGINFFNDFKFLNNKESKYFWEIYTKCDIDKNKANHFFGIVASKGRGEIIKGTVKIILDPNKSQNFKDGEILVTTMTSPEYVFLMKKAAAIITDTGGLTSHAAIVSREIGIPCIVGSKIATAILNNGDLVEIDVTKGIVRKLKK
jgi:phosphohistidine swiveling domain-containing protein